MNLDLLALSNQAKIVTFDVFDTLVHRRTRAPVDVFELVRVRAFEQNFALLHHDVLNSFTETRIQAEQNARHSRMAKHGGEGEVILDEIYLELGQITKLPVSIIDWLKDCELLIEEAVLYASELGLARYRAALATGCHVALVSDMYLPSIWIAKRLEALGFEGASKLPFYLSGEHRMSKNSGALYTHIARSTGWLADVNWLHIGDNHHSDVEMAKAAGLTAELADWSRVENKHSQDSSELMATTVRSIIGGLDLPQMQSRLPKDPLARIGYKIWGPMLFGFTCWLLSEFRIRKIERAIFVARDGWLPLRLIRLCQKRAGLEHLETDYFYMSRSTAYLAGVRDWNPERTWNYANGKSVRDARRPFNSAGLDASNYLSVLQQHGIRSPDQTINPEETWRIKDSLNSVFYDILLSAQAHRDNFSSYYEGAFASKPKIGFVDVGWIGNIQRCFVHSISEVTARDRVQGFYIGIHAREAQSNIRLGIKLNGWLNKSPKFADFQHALYSGGVELMEFILTADHGSTMALKHKEGGIEPILELQGAEELEHQRMALVAQSGAVQFVEDHMFLFDLFRADTLACTAWAQPFLRLVTQPTLDEIHTLSVVTHSDSAGSNQIRFPLATKISPSLLGSKRERKFAREKAFWKAAFDLLNS